MHERDMDEIRHHIDMIFRAYIEKDRDKLEPTYAPHWCGFAPSSRCIIQGFDAYMTEAEKIFKDWNYLDYEIVEIEYLFYGDVCVVPYVARARGGSSDGKTCEIKLRSVEVYVRQEGAWRQVASNTSLHPNSRSG
jgi:ketosteroid isomerase-like protein